jgi:hypothetical protein
MTMSRLARKGTPLLLGITSMMFSYWMLGFFAVISLIFGCTDYTKHSGQSWRSFAVLITRPEQVGSLLGCLSLALVSGGLGFRCAGAEQGMGRRFCVGGLVGTALGTVVLIGMIAYRWWG